MFETEFQMRLRDLNTANHVDNLEIMRVADEARALFLGGVEGERGAGFGVLAAMPAHVVVLAAAQHAEFPGRDPLAARRLLSRALVGRAPRRVLIHRRHRGLHSAG